MAITRNPLHTARAGLPWENRPYLHRSPFDSGADYVRKVKLRGEKAELKLKDTLLLSRRNTPTSGQMIIISNSCMNDSF